MPHDWGHPFKSYILSNLWLTATWFFYRVGVSQEAGPVYTSGELEAASFFRFLVSNLFLVFCFVFLVFVLFCFVFCFLLFFLSSCAFLVPVFVFVNLFASVFFLGGQWVYLYAIKKFNRSPKRIINYGRFTWSICYIWTKS